jgi:magnesium transporter
MKRPGNKKRQRARRLRHAPPGTPPGNILVEEGALKPRITGFFYTQDLMEERTFNGLPEVAEALWTFPDRVAWIDVQGFGSRSFMEELVNTFGIHRLQIEDVVNQYQRPKADEYEHHLFLISRIFREADTGLTNDQLSLFLGKNIVLTIRDRYDNVLDPVRDRLRHGKGFVRRYGADYLAYALMDVALDNLYPILEHLGDRLDELQDELLLRPTRDALNRILQIKRDLIVVRRSLWSERDKVNDILRSAFSQVQEDTKIFFRDTYDHCIQLLDLVESYREVTASLMDVYHSSVSHRMNQVMKVLTIISTIFIPLTFIVGLYGMNFADVHPVTGREMPWNMPELYQPYGYLTVCIVMVVIVVLQLIFFYRKGWLSKE